MTSKEWKNYKFSELVYILGGGTPKTTVSEYWNGTIPWLSVKDFNSGEKFVYTTEKTITQLGLEKSSTQLLKKNDIILSARGTVGEIAVIPHKMAFNQSCYGIRAKEEIINSDFLYYLLKNSINLLKHNTHGSVFDTITRETFDSIEIKLPPLETQQKIAKVLSAIDDKIELNNSINNNLEKQAQALFYEIYNNGKCGTIGDILEIIETGSRPKGGALTHGVPSIGAENINGFGVYDYSKDKFISAEFYNKLNRGIVKSKDVLLYKDGAYTGKVSMTLDDFPHKQCAVNEHVFLLRTNKLATQFFLYFCLLDNSNRQKIHTLACGKAAQPGLNQNELKSVPIKIPNIEDIINFDITVAPIMKQIANNAKEKQKLAQLRDTLLPKLISGEIDVSKVEIDDILTNQSADKLLFREDK
ncbi:hypothetical protein BHV42_04780 [Candidatus Melainabacteria bacterium MEL.A1]|nr:hypothetical protein BHV42_04780 [Candidatus Melainabacteria bacterium MEL.A1]